MGTQRCGKLEKKRKVKKEEEIKPGGIRTLDHLTVWRKHYHYHLPRPLEDILDCVKFKLDVTTLVVGLNLGPSFQKVSFTFEASNKFLEMTSSEFFDGAKTNRT